MPDHLLTGHWVRPQCKAQVYPTPAMWPGATPCTFLNIRSQVSVMEILPFVLIGLLGGSNTECSLIYKAQALIRVHTRASPGRTDAFCPCKGLTSGAQSCLRRVCPCCWTWASHKIGLGSCRRSLCSLKQEPSPHRFLAPQVEPEVVSMLKRGPH